MGYGFMIWAVDVDKLREVAGSKEEKLRRMIGGRFKRKLSELDDLFRSKIDAGGPNTYEALRQIIDGTIPPDRTRGGIYSYAFKLIVEHFGRFLNNSAICPWNRVDFEPMNRALAEMGVPLALEDILWNGLPVKLPYPDDFPTTGFADASRVKELDAAFSKAKQVEMDAETREIVDCVRGFIRDAASQGRGIVSYYH